MENVSKLAHCLNGCCFFVDGTTVTEAEYQEARRRHPASFPSTPPGGRTVEIEAIVACQKSRLDQRSDEEVKKWYNAVCMGNDAPYSRAALTTEMHRRGLL
jgi:hypothetical protein